MATMPPPPVQATMMQTTMMDLAMSTQMIMRHGARNHADASVVSYLGGHARRARYSEIASRAGLLAGALQANGIRTGDRVATFCWNHQEHLEAYLAVPSMGAILHTLNIRLFADQLRYIINHAGDRIVIADGSLLPLLADVLPECHSVERVIVTGASSACSEALIPAISYDEFLAGATPMSNWPELDENSAAVACYTSGTTGDPKGVVYSHKSIFAHSLASMGVDTFAISQADRILLMPPMFHANAWGLPFSGWFAGSDFVMPGPDLQANWVRAMIEIERPTFTAMVPTLVGDLLRAHKQAPVDMGSFRVIVSGGSPVAPALIDQVRTAWGVPMIQGWGMTETSPLCALSVPPAGVAADAETAIRAKSGRAVPGVEVRLVDADGKRLLEDGEAVGSLELRGPWVSDGYFAHEGDPAVTTDGWLKSGDVGTVDSQGYVQITDRAKDVIKSGGEWISSVALENLLLGHPAVAEAAVVAFPDPRWEERPLAVIVAAESACDPAPVALRAHLAAHVARFWLPEYWAHVVALPRTSVGKIDKRALREAIASGALEIIKVNADG